MQHLVSKSRKGILILYRAKKFSFNRNVMLTLIVWFSRTTLEDAAPVWPSELTWAKDTCLQHVQCKRAVSGLFSVPAATIM